MSKKKKDKTEEPKKGKTADAAAKAAAPVKLVKKKKSAEEPPAVALPTLPNLKKSPAPKKKAEKAETKKADTAVITNDDIALRAYFIAEKRRSHGHWGDEAGDWVEAERQLRAEAGKKKK